MPLKVVTAQVDGTEVRLENTWTKGARLYVGDKQVAENLDHFALDKKRPLMSVRVEVAGRERLVEVFCYAIFFVKLKICVDGVQVAGDQF